MTKQELILEIEEILAEIAILQWTKNCAIDFIRKKEESEPKSDLKVTYELIEGHTSWNIPVPTDSVPEAIDRLKKLPVFEKYFLFIFSLYEQYLVDNPGNKDKDSIELLRYRLIRNILIHNNKIVKQANIDEFSKKAKEYNQLITETELIQQFNYQAGAELSLLEFAPDQLIHFKDVLKKVL